MTPRQRRLWPWLLAQEGRKDDVGEVARIVIERVRAREPRLRTSTAILMVVAHVFQRTPKDKDRLSAALGRLIEELEER